MVLVLSEVASNYFMWLFGVLYVSYQIVCGRGKLIVKKFWGENTLLLLFLLGTFVGLFNVVGGSTKTWPYIRDIIHISSILLTCYFFNNTITKYSFNINIVYTTVFFFCGTYSMIVTLLAIPNYLLAGSDFYEFTFAGARISESILAIGLYLTFFRPKAINKFYVGPYIDRVLGIASIIAAMLAFSRTMILLFMCLCSIGLVKHMKQIAKILVVVFLGIFIITKVFPGMIESYFEKILHSFQEISSAQSVWDNASIVQNWRGYEVYCAIEEYDKYTFLEQLFGKGFGATVDVGEYAYLVTSEDTLPYLHNGYYTTLIKNGILGIILVVLYWFSLLYGIKKLSVSKNEKNLAFGIVIGLALSMFFIHGVFWGGNEEVFYLFLVCMNTKSDMTEETMRLMEEV